MPFNWKTPHGYAIAIFLNFASALSIVLSVLPNACYSIGSHWLSVTFIDDVINDFHILNSKKFKRRNKEIKQLLIKIIDDVSDLKQLSDFKELFFFIVSKSFFSLKFSFSSVKLFTEIHEFIILDLFLWALLTISRFLYVYL